MTMQDTVPGTDLDLTDPGDPSFAAHVAALLRAVAHHDAAALQVLCDDSLGIVDAGPDLTPVVVEDQAAHAAWFDDLFATLSAMGARTWSTVTDLRSEFLGATAAHSAVEFTQHLELQERTAEFDCVATVVWKRTDDARWVEARWHVSTLEARVPAGFPAA